MSATKEINHDKIEKQLRETNLLQEFFKSEFDAETNLLHHDQ